MITRLHHISSSFSCFRRNESGSAVSASVANLSSLSSSVPKHRKISLIYFFCQLDPSKTPAANTPTVYQQPPRVYLHTPDDCIFSGVLENIRGPMVPFWVTQPRQRYSSIYRVYVRMPTGNGLASCIEPLDHDIDINNDIPEQNRCFVSIGRNVFLVALLHRYNLQTLPTTNKPRIFVRMPDGNNTVFVGELDYTDTRHPSWLQ